MLLFWPYLLRLGALVGARQTPAPPPEVVATWAVTLVCTEYVCPGPSGVREGTTGGRETQAWTLTRQQGRYYLTANAPGEQPVPGTFDGRTGTFNRVTTGTGPLPARQVRFTLNQQGGLTGQLHVAPPSAAGIPCIVRYTAAGLPVTAGATTE